ncbi:MAG: phospho-N-acetylmuramoyl-pentapeptide-transferase, partial [Nitrospirae bacterium]
MLYELLYSLHGDISVFNVFRYITFRTALSIFTALILSLILGPIVIKKMKRMNYGQTIRDDGPPTHQKKSGTPTMGGIFIVISILISTLLWTDLHNKYIWLMIFSTSGFALVGFFDDYLKLTKRSSKGLKGWYKFGIQCILALCIA